VTATPETTQVLASFVGRAGRLMSTLRRNPVRIALGTAGVALFGFITYWWAHISGPHHAQFDLQIYYRTVEYWADGHDIYNYVQPDAVNGWLGFTYPPLAAVLMRPMAGLSLSVVTVLTVIGIVLTTAYCVWLSVRDRFAFAGRAMWLAVGLGTCLAFDLEPLRSTLSFGQVNTFLAALVMADVLVLGRRGSRWTGIGIGLAMAIKITPGVFLLYLVLSKQWRATVIALCTALATTLLSAVVTPLETWHYYTGLLWDSGRVGLLGSSANQSVNGLLSRFSYPYDPSKGLWLAALVLVLAVSVIRIRSAVRAGDHLVAMTITGFAGILVSPASWFHHMIWVIPAVVVLARIWTDAILAVVRGEAPPMRQRLRQLALPFVLSGTGAFILGCDTNALLHLPSVDYSQANVFQIVGASLEMLWALAALCLLPIRGAVRSGRNNFWAVSDRRFLAA
jgi:alpha-1,2-mannosyltransferase